MSSIKLERDESDKGRRDGNYFVMRDSEQSASDWRWGSKWTCAGVKLLEDLLLYHSIVIWVMSQLTSL